MTEFTLPLLEWCDIPAGQVTLEDGEGMFDVAPFRIARFPVTNTQYDAFITDGGHKNGLWWDGLAQPMSPPRASDWRDADAPKLEVCWFEAVAFARWLADLTGLPVRLPTEWEWQWAAVGDSGWDYPYGAAFDGAKCNTKEAAAGRTNCVTDYAAVTTRFGTVDMAGNVAEWCLNEGANPANVGIEGMEKRALRGGSWSQAANNARTGFRGSRSPRTRQFNIGFRVMVGQSGL